MCWTLGSFLLAVALADAGSTGTVSTKDDAAPGGSVQGSDKEFFGKDYPYDKRPKVDVLHFKHPYPVVQDSDDFDKDYVKDENSDNGEFKAQTEYDRLRHKLAKEKQDVAKALANKNEAENELHDATKREKDHEEKVRKHKEEEEKKKKEEEEKKVAGGSHSEVKVVVPAAEEKTPGGAGNAGQAADAAAATQAAMDALDECKKQLAEAREKLKKLLEELEEAKKKQQETEAALKAAEDRLKPLEEAQEGFDKDVKDEYQEYLDAKKAYELQQAKMAKMEMDIAAAAAKVKAIRDAEDKNGGVYPTKESGAVSHSVAFALLLSAFMLQH